METYYVVYRKVPNRGTCFYFLQKVVKGCFYSGLYYGNVFSFKCRLFRFAIHNVKDFYKFVVKLPVALTSFDWVIWVRYVRT